VVALTRPESRPSQNEPARDSRSLPDALVGTRVTSVPGPVICTLSTGPGQLLARDGY
jgi:hypothetical protein